MLGSAMIRTILLSCRLLYTRLVWERNHFFLLPNGFGYARLPLCVSAPLRDDFLPSVLSVPSMVADFPLCLCPFALHAFGVSAV
jgi:hypothetical protein